MSAGIDEQRRDDLVERLFQATLGTLELFGVHLGRRLGLYAALSEPLTSDVLAERTGIDPRYAREWCEQQAVAGFLETTSSDDARTFVLPHAYRGVLVEVEDPAHVAPLASMIAGVGAALPLVVDAYRTGGGVDYSNYGFDFREGQGSLNRPTFVNEMKGWLAASDAIRGSLEKDGARVADVGCGQGYSTVAIARAFPRIRVDGYDLDAPSIAEAKEYGAASDVADRVAFLALDAREMKSQGPYDLACIFEALHDMSQPVDALVAVREGLAPGGSVLLCDERVADSFRAPGDEIERFMYGWSVSHCLPAGMAEQPSAAIGTVLRAEMVERLAREAGFGEIEVLDIENDFFRFYRLVP